jgi:hypothetical protein
VIWVLLLSGLLSGKAKVPATVSALDVKGTRLHLEIASDDSGRAQGLSKRTSLGWNNGMLFVFPSEEERTFWMIDCAFDLDIAYLDRDGIVQDEQTMVVQPGVVPELLRRYVSATDHVMYALEVNRGWLAAHFLRVGDTLRGVKAWTTKR